MTQLDYTKIADVLEAVAEYADGLEYKKQAEETEARTSRINKLAERYENSTGASLPEAMRGKLASLDQETLDHLLKVANNNGESPTSLGGPAERSDDTLPRTVKEAAAQADERFLSWLTSD